MGKQFVLLWWSAILAQLVMGQDTFDVIIIGSGPGGLVAAEYLTRDPSVSVLVLEAGGPSLAENGGTDVPSYAQGSGLTRFDIPGEYTSVAFQNDNRYRPDWIASPFSYVGKLVGGSSSLNGMLYFHPPDSYLTETSWPFDAAAVNNGFSAIEQMFSYTYNPSPDNKRYLQEAYEVLRGALGSNGYQEVNINEVGPRNNKKQTFGHPPFAIKNGMRDSPGKTFYGALKNRPNFRLRTFALVSHIVQSKGTASKVVYSQNGGQSVTVSLTSRGAILMAAGALSTPKVLIQSGIGPYDQLNMLKNTFPGISGDALLWAVNENVGKHIFDTHEVLTTFSNNAMNQFIFGSPSQSTLDLYFNKNHSGPYSSPDPVLIGYDSITVNNIPYQFQITGFCHGFNGNSDPKQYGIAVYVNNPLSRDRCTFASDRSWHCDTDHTLYSDPNDQLALSTYLAKLRQILSSTGSTPVAPSANDDPLTWVKQHLVGTNHYGGSCYTSSNRNDGNRCSDETFKVVNTKNVFVGDASLMKTGTVNPYGWVMYSGYQAGVNIAKYLSNTGPTPTPTPTSTPAPQCSSTQMNTDILNNDLTSTSQTDIGNCCLDCARTTGCAAFVYTSHNGGTCWLKSATGPTISKSGAQMVTMQSGNTTPTPTPTTSPPPASQCSSPQMNTDIVNGDITSTQQADIRNCCQDCARTAGCVAYVFTNSNGGTCWLKSATSPTKFSSGAQMVTFQSTTTPTPTTPTPTTSPPSSQCSNVQANADIVNNDITSTRQSDIRNCCQDCARTPECVAYVYTNYNGGTCWLKSATGPTVFNSGAQMVTLQSNPPPSQCSTTQLNTDIVKNDLTSTSQSDVKNCCQDCIRTPSCVAYVYTNYNGGTCWLKSAKGPTAFVNGAQMATVV